MRVLSIISWVLTIIVLVALIIFFAIEKPIPTDWAKGTIVDSTSVISATDYKSLSTKNKYGCRKVVTEYSVNKTGVKLVTSRVTNQVELVGTKDNLIVKKVVTEYDTFLKPVSETVEYFYKKNGGKFYKYSDKEEEVNGTEWETGILSAMRSALPVDSEGNYLYAELTQKIENVSQIGVFVAGRVSDGDNELKLEYDFMNRQLKTVSYTQNTKSSDETQSVIKDEYQILFPTKIDLPEAVR